MRCAKGKPIPEMNIFNYVTNDLDDTRSIINEAIEPNDTLLMNPCSTSSHESC